MMKRAVVGLFLVAMVFAVSSCGKKAPLRYPPADSAVVMVMDNSAVQP